jgi:hypothetical protein
VHAGSFTYGFCIGKLKREELNYGYGLVELNLVIEWFARRTDTCQSHGAITQGLFVCVASHQDRCSKTVAKLENSVILDKILCVTSFSIFGLLVNKWLVHVLAIMGIASIASSFSKNIELRPITRGTGKNTAIFLLGIIFIT